MRCLSKVFQPLITIPKETKIKNTEITCKSQKLLLECGLVRPAGSGLFVLLPLARRALWKLEALARAGVEAEGAQQVALPALAAAALWERSGRLQSAPAELLKVDDRHGKKYILAPTHEEGIADLLADVGPLSHKQLPMILYQVSAKYRDEARPKHGLLRAREFLMLDAYSLHADEPCALEAYGRLAAALRALFAALRLPVHRVRAAAGAMGGSLSHEWQLCAPAGEDALRVCGACARAAPPAASACPRCGGAARLENSIEVAHTFVLGTRYSEPLGAHYVPALGAARPLHMACYGIGLTRLLSASVEALSTETALRWPEDIAPYHTLIIGPKEGSKGCERGAALALAAGEAVRGAGRDVLLDDRTHLTLGKRLLQADRMGYPQVVVAGRAALDSPPRLELHRPGREGEALVTLEELAALSAGAARAPPRPLAADGH